MNRELIEQAAKSVVFENNGEKTYYQKTKFIFLQKNIKVSSDKINKIIIAVKNKHDVKWYSSDNMEICYDSLCSVCPLLVIPDLDITNTESKVQSNWKHIDLGLEEHLLIHKDYYDIFTEYIYGKNISRIKANWQGVAQLLLNNYMTDTMTFEMLCGIRNKISEKDYPQIHSVINSFIDEENKTVHCSAYDIAIYLHDCDGTELLPKVVAEFLFKTYKGEINLGNTDAGCDIGSLYYTGRAGIQSFAKAVKYYKIAADGGCKQAQENLDYCYYYGRDVEVNYEKAFNYFALAAFNGYIRSLYKIGDMYRNGYYVKKNEKQAFSVYQRCVDTMDDDEMFSVGADVMMRMVDCYYYGIGAETDYQNALEYYQKAEQLFYKRLQEGDFLIKGCYKKVITKQAEVRKILIDSIPSFDWTM